MGTQTLDKFSVNLADAAYMLCVSESMVRKLIKDGTLPAAKLGTSVRIQVEDIRKLFKAREQNKVASA